MSLLLGQAKRTGPSRSNGTVGADAGGRTERRSDSGFEGESQLQLLESTFFCSQQRLFGQSIAVQP